MLLRSRVPTDETAVGWSEGCGRSAVGLFAGRRDCQRGFTGGVGDSEERSWDVLMSCHPAKPPASPGRRPPAALGSSKAAKLPASVKADLSCQHPPPPASLVGWPLWDVSPSAFRMWLPETSPSMAVFLFPSRSARAPVSDISERIQSPVLQSECITRQGASARRFGFDNKSPCFREFKSDFKTSPLMFF